MCDLEFVQKIKAEKNKSREEAIKDTLKWLGVEEECLDKIIEIADSQKENCYGEVEKARRN